MGQEQGSRGGRRDRKGTQQTPRIAPGAYPEDLEAERWCLASLHGAGDDPVVVDHINDLQEEDFSHPNHRAVFSAIRLVVQSQDRVDLLSIKKALIREGRIDDVGGFAGLQEILHGGESGDLGAIVRTLKQHTKRRRLLDLSESVGEKARRGVDDPDEVIDSAVANLMRIGQVDQRSGDPQALSVIGGDATERLLAQMSGQRVTGVRVGWRTLDDMTQGFKGGNLIILAARPGIGKTALALSWLHRAALLKDAHAGCMFSLEMSLDELWARMLSLHSGLNLQDLKRAHPPEAQIHEAVKRAMRELQSLPLSLSDKASLTVPQIRNSLKKIMGSGKRVDWALIDYLQLLRSPEGSFAARQNESNRIAEISRDLKLMAKDLDIPVIVLSQLNREVEHRHGRPQLSDLRDSGAIEQDADIVMFIHRKTNQQAVELDGSQNQGELIIAKHRNGPCGTIPIMFKPECTLYREMERWSMGDDHYQSLAHASDDFNDFALP
jgi:replicative DNA helicase